jgi:hypothetical protein
MFAREKCGGNRFIKQNTDDSFIKDMNYTSANADISYDSFRSRTILASKAVRLYQRSYRKKVKCLPEFFRRYFLLSTFRYFLIFNISAFTLVYLYFQQDLIPAVISLSKNNLRYAEI